jgi:hypothetical protein
VADKTIRVLKAPTNTGTYLVRDLNRFYYRSA